MTTYTARSQWNGTLKDGSGRVRVGSGSFETAFSPKVRKSEITNPEEMVGAALSACYSLKLAKTLNASGYTFRSIETAAAVDLTEGAYGPSISKISLIVHVDCDDLDVQTLQNLAKKADDACPVSRALSGTSIEIDAKLTGGNDNN